MKKVLRLGEAGKALLVGDGFARGRAARRDLERTRSELTKARTRIRAQRAKIARLKDELEASSAKLGALPDFLIIGAAKCGTSSFYRALLSHPRIVGAARKEIHYFDSGANFRKGNEWYASHFFPVERRDNPNTITGEASPRYLYEKEAPARAARVVPDARLVVLLRDPADRTYSAWSHAVRRTGRRRKRQGQDVTPKIGFAEFVRAELAGEGVPPGFAIARLARSVYVDQIERWHEHFDREQLLVLASEDLFGRGEAGQRDVYARTLEHLGVPEWQPEAVPVSNRRSFKEGMTPETREELRAFFEPHNRRLYEYLGRDFGW